MVLFIFFFVFEMRLKFRIIKCKEKGREENLYIKRNLEWIVVNRKRNYGRYIDRTFFRVFGDGRIG